MSELRQIVSKKIYNSNTNIIEILKLAIEYKFIDINNMRMYDLPLLHYYIHDNKLECVKLLIEKGININIQDNRGDTALLFAYHKYAKDKNKPSTMRYIKLLLKMGADVNIQNFDGKTPLMIAIECCDKTKSIHCVKILLKAGAKLDITDDYKNNVLHHLSRFCNDINSIKCMKLLLSNTSKDIINSQNEQGNTPLMVSMLSNKTSSIECSGELIKSKCDVNIINNKGHSPLTIICSLRDELVNQRYEQIKILLEAGGDVNYISTPHNNSPLQHLLYDNYKYKTNILECMKLLLEAGADICLESDDGYNSLMTACCYHTNTECVKYLLSKCTPEIVNIQDHVDGWTALMMAANFCSGSSSLECVQLLIDNGAVVNASVVLPSVQCFGDSVLTILMGSNNSSLECVKLLLDNGADINYKHKKSGFTPLMIAAQNIKKGFTTIEYVDLLLEHGADKTITLDNGHTYLDFLPSEYKKPSTEIYLGRTCCICYNDLKRIISMQPCGHANTCHSCYEKMKEFSTDNDYKCPSCKTPIKEYKTINII
jgi:ankyrin repeat protein